MTSATAAAESSEDARATADIANGVTTSYSYDNSDQLTAASNAGR